MAGTPYYLITSCCDQSTTQGQFIIPGSGIITNGVYIFNGISFQEGSTGMWFYSGYCYQIEYLGTTLSTYPSAFNEADITISIANDCASSDCVPCDGPAIPPSYTIYNCCDAANIVNLNINITSCSVLDGTWVYDGDGYSTDGGFVFTPGDCYNFTRIEEGVYENGPDCTEFTISNKSCAEAQVDGDCPACDLGLQYLAFRSCCGPTTILFKGIDANSYYGIREYLGTLVDGLENICYSIVIGNVGDSTVPNLAAYNALPNPPAYIETVTFSTISMFSTDCESFTSSCPSCLPLPCYTLYNCAGESFNTTVDLSAYTNTWILITNYADSISGPYIVIENTGKCEDAINTIAFANTASPCQSKCYEAIGEGEVTYINDTYNLVTAYSPFKFCSYIYPTVSPGIVLTQGGNCADTGEGMQCPKLCYKLTNCETEEIIYSNTQSLERYYFTTSVVTLNGYEGCWTITVTGDNCDCAVPVTVLTAFETCQECLPVVAYQFTNCQNPAIVLYSSEDFSGVVGLSVLLECDTDCYTVTQINFVPPVESVITVLTTYSNCTDCLRRYYLLEDCLGVQSDIYTFTNLSAYIGDVIKLKDCDTCWRVSSIQFLPDNFTADIVSFETSYDDCEACLVSAPCVCSRIRNDQTTARAFEYIDCNGELVTLPSLQPGETSARVCLISWEALAVSEGYIEYYGDCIDGTCPPIVYPVRYVKPGYNTPVCDAEKWDKITCKSSEILYKSVLKGRYGISNCCDEPTDKWLIKKELIDLAALVDPHYECTETSCGCPPSTCGCDCGSTLKTCNSN
jgi:hypothetical protein